MVKKQQAKRSKSLDIILWILSAILLAAGIAANYYFAGQPLSLRIVGWLVLICIILAIISRTKKGQQAWKFFRDAKGEIRKVVWPTRQETIQTTLIVIVMVIILALLLWGADSFLMWAVGWLTGQRG